MGFGELIVDAAWKDIEAYEATLWAESTPSPANGLHFFPPCNVVHASKLQNISVCGYVV